MSSMLLIKRPVYVNDDIDRANNVHEINANFCVPVIVETKMLNRQMVLIVDIKQECFERTKRSESCLTVLAQLPAGSTFKKFGHEGGVEFFVLSGEFSDSDRSYGTGCYVRNAAGIYREFFTDSGCTVLFKLGQFQTLDRNRVVMDTRDPTVRWQPVGEPGVSRLSLHKFAEEEVSLYRIRSECWITFKYQSHGVEMFVCDGSIFINGSHYAAGSWLRYPAGRKVRILTIGGVYLYVRKSIFSK